MDKIKKKLVNYKNLDREFRTYFDKFSGTIGSYYEEDIKRCSEMIKKYEGELGSVAKITHLRSDEDAFTLTHHMNQMDLIMCDVQERFEFFNPGKHRFTQEFSTTYLTETSAMFDKVIVLICQTRKKNLSYDFDIIVYLGAKIMTGFGLHEAMPFYEKVRGYYKKYTSSVSLYAYIVQEIIDFMFMGEKESRVDAFKIMNRLEEDKNEALAAGLAEAKFEGSKNNPALLLFGLVPVSELMGVADIIQMVFNQTVSSADEVDDKKLFNELGVSNKVGIVVCRKITMRPTDYTIGGLTEKSKMSGDTGINSYLVKKLQTINNVSTRSEPSVYDFSVSRYGMSLNECRNIVIMDELVDGKYKVMSSWNTKTYIVPVHEVIDFVEYSKRGVIDKPTRAENYNKVMIGRMINTMFLERSVNVRQITDQSQVDEIKFLRNIMYNNLVAHYADIIDSQYSEGKDIKNNKDLIKIINDPSIKDVFVKTLIENYHEFLKKNEFIGGDKNDSGHFVFNEVLATFLAQLHVIIRGFVREIFSNSEKYEPSSSIYEKSFLVMYAEVKDVIDKVVKESLAKTLSDKSNSYQSLIYKTMILNL